LNLSPFLKLLSRYTVKAVLKTPPETLLEILIRGLGITVVGSQLICGSYVTPGISLIPNLQRITHATRGPLARVRED